VKRIRERVAGLDVHRDTVVACCQVKQPDQSVEVTKQSFATTANGLRELAAWLRDAGVDTVAMEATGVYWKPVVRHEAPSNRGEVQGLLLQAVAAPC
jgi:transposase